MEPEWALVVESGWALANEENRFIEYFAEISRRHPSSARAKFELANILDYLDREAEAIPLYEEAIRIGLSAEYHVYALIQLGSSLRNVGRTKEAVEILSQAEKHFPEFSSISLFLGLAQYSEGTHVEALKTVMTAMLRHFRSSDLRRYANGLEHYINAMK